eukprot:gi/632988871/ref/XP_007883346.1/ PREDICTED: formin-B-like [Callorhinchus milii]
MSTCPQPPLGELRPAPRPPPAPPSAVGASASLPRAPASNQPEPSNIPQTAMK